VSSAAKDCERFCPDDDEEPPAVGARQLRPAREQNDPGGDREGPESERNEGVTGEGEARSQDSGRGNERERLEARPPEHPQAQSGRQRHPAEDCDHEEDVGEHRQSLEPGRDRHDPGRHHEREGTRVQP
jgi:hypothetical protein